MLFELMNGIRTVSVIGMCKNAGKTTVLNRLIRECEAHGQTIGLTSIGRDGERSDLVTNTKKPEIFVSRGALVATAEQLLKLGDISQEVLDVSGLTTPMGRIVFVRAMTSGYVQLGGASITEHQKLIRDELLAFGADCVMIDGAISRKSLGTPALCDGAVLSSGASYDPSVEKTAADTAFTARLFSLAEEADSPGELRFTAVRGGERFESDEALGLVPFIKGGAERILVRGAVTDSIAAQLVQIGKLIKNAAVLAEDASRLLLKQASFERLLRTCACVGVMKGTRLCCVTVNPFSAYGLHYGADEFFERVCRALERNGVRVPVINVEANDNA